MKEDEIDFLACLGACAQDGFSLRAAMAAAACDESMARVRLSYLQRISLLNNASVGNRRFVFHRLIRLFAQELAIERSLAEQAAERHARFYVDLVKSSGPGDREAESVLAEELDDILLAADWLQRTEAADYEFVLRLEPFFQRYGHWSHAVTLMANFLALAERIEDWDAVVQLRIQQAKYLTLRGEFTEADQVLAPIASILANVSSTARDRCEAMYLNTLGGVLQRLGRFDEAASALERSLEFLMKQRDERGQAMVLNSLGGCCSGSDASTRRPPRCSVVKRSRKSWVIDAVWEWCSTVWAGCCSGSGGSTRRPSRCGAAKRSRKSWVTNAVWRWCSTVWAGC